MLHHQATQETTPQALPNRVYRHLFPKKETSCQFLIHNSELYRIEFVVSATKTPSRGFWWSDMYTIPGKLYTSGEYVKQLCIPIGESDLKNHMGVNLGITPHPPVLIRRSESTLPLVVMAVNNPLLLN